MGKSDATVVQTPIMPGNAKNRVPDLIGTIIYGRISRTSSCKLDQSSTHTTSGCVVDPPSLVFEIFNDHCIGGREIFRGNSRNQSSDSPLITDHRELTADDDVASLCAFRARSNDRGACGEVRVWVARVAGHGARGGGDGDWLNVVARQGSRMRGGKGVTLGIYCAQQVQTFLSDISACGFSC